MVDFHGATKPSGLERTYPNVMGYEGVLGMEQSKAGMRDNPEQSHHDSVYADAGWTDGLHAGRVSQCHARRVCAAQWNRRW